MILFEYFERCISLFVLCVYFFQRRNGESFDFQDDLYMRINKMLYVMKDIGYIYIGNSVWFFK